MNGMSEQDQWLSAARAGIEWESDALRAVAQRLDSLVPVVELLLRHTGKVVATGIGKSGHVARQIAATLQSIGAPAAFLHPTEAGHGDIGVCQPGDVVVLVSKSGSTAELLNLIGPLRLLNVRLIGILGNLKSPLTREMDFVLDASVQREADPAGFMPTSSTMAALAMGHALAIALMQARGFTAADFHRYHPAGQLGQSLRHRVRDVMHPTGQVACVAATDSLKHVVMEMSLHPWGAACVVEGSRLAGLVTDGDIRRTLQKHDDLRTLTASQAMTESPTTVGPDVLIQEALRLMEDRPSQISVLPVVDPGSGAWVGLIRIHDIYHRDI